MIDPRQIRAWAVNTGYRWQALKQFAKRIGYVYKFLQIR